MRSAPTGPSSSWPAPEPTEATNSGSPIWIRKRSNDAPEAAEIRAGLDRRRGCPRCYFRRPGYPRVRLPGLSWSPQFLAAYEEALKGPAFPIGAGQRSKPGSVSTAIGRITAPLTLRRSLPAPSRCAVRSSNTSAPSMVTSRSPCYRKKGPLSSALPLGPESPIPRRVHPNSIHVHDSYPGHDSILNEDEIEPWALKGRDCCRNSARALGIQSNIDDLNRAREGLRGSDRNPKYRPSP
jgi:hypothetical protein